MITTWRILSHPLALIRQTQGRRGAWPRLRRAARGAAAPGPRTSSSSEIRDADSPRRCPRAALTGHRAFRHPVPRDPILARCRALLHEIVGIGAEAASLATGLWHPRPASGAPVVPAPHAASRRPMMPWLPPAGLAADAPLPPSWRGDAR